MLKKLVSHTSELILQAAIAEELFASHFYRHLSAQCQRLGWEGAAEYFAEDSADEIKHYQLLADYLNARGSVAESPAIPACAASVASLGDALEAAYQVEVALSSKYAEWHKSLQAADPLTAQFLLQFLEIQRTSVGDYGDWLARFNLCGADNAALLVLDQELGRS